MTFHIFINPRPHLLKDLPGPRLLLHLPQYSSFIAGTHEDMRMGSVSLRLDVCR